MLIYSAEQHWPATCIIINIDIYYKTLHLHSVHHIHSSQLQSSHTRLLRQPVVHTSYRNHHNNLQYSVEPLHPTSSNPNNEHKPPTMGKLGRIVCITTPMVLTIAAFLTQVVINVAGWDKNSDALNSLYFFQADFSQLDITAANDISQGLELAGALQIARSTGLLAATYNIHLWNYCSSDSTLANGTEGEVDFCSDRQAKFWFNPVEVWGLDNSESRSQLVEATGEDRNLIEQTLDNLQGNVGDLANMVLDESSQDALNTYQTVSKWMFIAYQASLWVTLATIVAGVLAIFSRWGSLLTWILSLVSSIPTCSHQCRANMLTAYSRPHPSSPSPPLSPLQSFSLSSPAPSQAS